ncbi:MAG: hypothetical protein SNG14_06525 [Rikenellaceae bacterium]
MKRAVLTLSLTAAVAMSAVAQEVTSLPKEVAKNYLTKYDTSISDEFNGKDVDWTKWGRRNTGGAYIEKHVKDKSLVVMESEKEGKETTNYLSIKGIASDGNIRTAGIVTRSTGYYGFYTLRFRFKGLDSEEVRKKKTIWHPSVWGAVMSNTAGSKLKCASGGYWLELDFMEWNPGAGGWGSHTNARFVDKTGKSRIISDKAGEKAAMKDSVKENFDQWTTIGMEYTSKYIRIWQWDESAKSWSMISDRDVTFVPIDLNDPEASYTKSTIGDKSQQPHFWIVGNVVSRYLYPRIANGTVTHTMLDMSVDYDYFRYYPQVSIANKKWSCKK